MSMFEDQYEVLLTPDSVVTTSAAAVGKEWAPGMSPHVITAFVVILDVGAGVVGAIELKKIGMNAGATASVIGTLNLLTTDVDGSMVYKLINEKIMPGEKVFVNVPSALSGGPTIKAVIRVKQSWESPANISLMRATA